MPWLPQPCTGLSPFTEQRLLYGGFRGVGVTSSQGQMRFLHPKGAGLLNTVLLMFLR